MTFTIWDVKVECSEEEYGIFDPPSGSTCGDYMSGFLNEATGYLRDPVSDSEWIVCSWQNATSNCQYCGYSNGQEYLANLNLTKHVYGYRDMCITL